GYGLSGDMIKVDGRKAQSLNLVGLGVKHPEVVASCSLDVEKHLESPFLSSEPFLFPSPRPDIVLRFRLF
ncbi:hypothetical protein L195_g057651, partial [Trifolium pratense]